MRWLKTVIGVAAAMLLTASSMVAQTTTGTITGRVSDTTGLSVPGVTITIEGPNLQGIQTVVTQENGDYIVPLLPPGAYTVTFQLTGFERQQKAVSIAATQTLPLNVTIGLAALAETVTVVAPRADVLVKTAQVATNFKAELIATLPTNRDINATLLMAPAVHPSGPAGNYSIAGAMSFESLFMVNGVTANENLRGQAYNLYIEDAIQETVVATDGISAEYGRFSGGIVNVITKSGTNLFSGSFRDSLNDDNWRALVVGNGNFAPLATGQTTPLCNFVTGIGGTQIRDPHCFAGDQKIRDVDVNQVTHWVIPTYEYVFGGPIVKDRLTFFTAGRFQNQQVARATVNPTNIAFINEEQRKRYELKFTGSLNSSHRFEGSYQKEAVTQVNNAQSFANTLDLASLYTRDTPLDSYQVNYSGVLSSKLFVEGRYSMRRFTFIGSGAPTTDLINGTLLLDRARGNLRYFSPTFCGVCDPQKRDNDNEYVRVTYFKSTKSSGSHNVAFGFDTFNDKVFANNHQSGSDYRILGTTSIIRGTGADSVIYPQFLPTSTILQYNPIASSSLGTNFRTNALFVNDGWRYNDRLTFNLGLRYDKNHGVDSAGSLVANDSAWSPRVGLVWDPKGDGAWSVSASFAKYTAALSGGVADLSSSAGQPSTFQWTYAGPALNPDATAATLLTPAQAIAQVFAWCARDARGFCTSAPPSQASVAGVSVKIPNGLSSPNVRAYAFGVSRQIGTRAIVRADYSYRDYHDFYSQRIDRSTGTVTDSLGNPSDLTVTENTDDLKRRYSGVTVSATYRMNGRTNIGGNYTLSRLWGNFEGENVNSGPLTSDVFQYPEYRQVSWYAPEGDLAQDQRHRSTMWINYGVPGVNGLTLSLLQDLASGLPYGAGGGNPAGQIGFSASASVNAIPYVTNPGYVTPQGGSSENYYYTARDAFHTETSRRTDFAASYNHPFGAGSRKIEAFVQAQVLNIFNNQDLCGCGATVFSNGGAVALNTIGSGVLTPGTGSLALFNPFTTTPVQGVNWNYAANFGAPLNRFAFTSPRTFRLTFGVRF
jgi:outer membrane receptor protein involved in Fe transport